MTLDQSGNISWLSPIQGDHLVSIEARDNRGGRTDHDYILSVRNKFDDLSGRVTNMFDGNPIMGVDVALGHRDAGTLVIDKIERSDGNGDYLFRRVETGINRLVLLDHPNYWRHLAGSIQTARDEANVNFELVPNDPLFLDFLNEVARDPNLGGYTKRWEQVPEVYINISPALGSGILPTTQEIDLAERVFRELANVMNGFTNNIRITIGTNPPPYRTPGIIRFDWRDDIGGALGVNGAYLDQNDQTKIISAIAAVRTGLTGSQQEGVNKQEITQPWGPLTDYGFPSPQSVFSDPQTAYDYTEADRNLLKWLYSRARGNRTETNGILIPDANPDSYRIR